MPESGDETAPHNRIDHLTYTSFHKHFLGDGLPRLYQTFSITLTDRLSTLVTEDEWIEHQDIMEFWLEPLTASINEALVGKILESVNPSFTKELLCYFPYIQDMMKGLPRWYIPEAYRLRDKLIADVKRWHAIARRCFRDIDIEAEGHSNP